MAFKKLTYEKTETIDIAEKTGQVTEGTYLGNRPVDFGKKDDGSPDIRYIVEMEGPLGAEDKFSFWANTAIKNSLPQIPEGSKVRFTFRGMEKNPKSGRKFNAFDIEVDDGTDAPQNHAGSGVRI